MIAQLRSTADRGKVEAAFDAFASDLYEMVSSHADHDVPRERARRLADQMFAAAASATSGDYGVADISDVASPSELRPAQLDLGRMLDHLRANV